MTQIAKLEQLSEFARQRGYTVTEEFGQRLTGPKLTYSGPPPKGCEVFVARIPYDLYEIEIIPYFEQVGEIYQFRLMIDFNGGNRGFAYVKYCKEEDAKKAIEMLDGFVIRRGKQLQVSKSYDNCRLYIGGIPMDKNEMDIRNALEKFVNGIVKVFIYPSFERGTKNRGFTFVEFESHRCAAIARRVLMTVGLNLWGKSLAIDWADPEPEDSVLHIRNLLPGTTEQLLAFYFNLKTDNGVEKVKIFDQYAFVYLNNRELAEKAKKELNFSVINGSIIEINWARKKKLLVKNKSRNVNIGHGNLSKKEPIGQQEEKSVPLELLSLSHIPQQQTIVNTNPTQINSAAGHENYDLGATYSGSLVNFWTPFSPEPQLATIFGNLSFLTATHPTMSSPDSNNAAIGYSFSYPGYYF